MSVDGYRTQSPWTDPGPFTDGLRAIDPAPSPRKSTVKAAFTELNGRTWNRSTTSGSATSGFPSR